MSIGAAPETQRAQGAAGVGGGVLEPVPTPGAKAARLHPQSPLKGAEAVGAPGAGFSRLRTGSRGFEPPAAAAPTASATPAVTPAARGAGRRARTVGAIAALAAALVLVMVVGAARGTVAIPLGHVVGIALHQVGVPVDVTWPEAEESIIWQLRLPRVVAAALVGAALATSGALLQGLFRNPLADPYVLGISSGAGLAATIAMTVIALGARASATASILRFSGFGPVPVAASAGGLVAVLLVYSLARRGGRVPTVRLLLAGFAVSSMLSAGSTLLLVLGDRLLLNWRALLGWLVGGVAVSGWAQVRFVTPLILVAIVASWLLARWLDALLLGEEGAAQVGVPVEVAKVLAVFFATVLTGSAVAIAGLVGFVGLLVPHGVRLVLGPAHRALLPAASLAGAAFLVLADLFARTLLAPTELPVGAITAIVGGPTFLWLLRRETAALRRE